MIIGLSVSELALDMCCEMMPIFAERDIQLIKVDISKFIELVIILL